VLPELSPQVSAGPCDIFSSTNTQNKFIVSFCHQGALQGQVILCQQLCTSFSNAFEHGAGPLLNRFFDMLWFFAHFILFLLFNHAFACCEHHVTAKACMDSFLGLAQPAAVIGTEALLFSTELNHYHYFILLYACSYCSATGQPRIFSWETLSKLCETRCEPLRSIRRG
jgi:hypothetical protein